MTAEDRATRLAEVMAKYAEACPYVGDAPEDVRLLLTELQASDTRVKEMAGLLREAADNIRVYAENCLASTRCYACDAKIWDGGKHTDECLVTRLRSAADHAAKDRTHE